MREPIQLITTALLDATIERARGSERRRINHNFHADDAANPHRFLNALIRGTYVTPHRHVTPPKHESFLVLTGQVAFFLFDADGNISNCYRMCETGVRGIDLAPGIWHSMAALSESAVIYEVKPGPYAPASDKDFAPFAPREGDASATEYLKRLMEFAEATR
ncbi:MAG TPA: WbuC family cupin fold metalloprotein [Polyangiaceae bacterium]